MEQNIETACFSLIFVLHIHVCQGGAPTSNGQPFSPDRSYLPSTDEVTNLLDNQFALFQHLEGQVDFYKVSQKSIELTAFGDSASKFTFYSHLEWTEQMTVFREVSLLW